MACRNALHAQSGEISAAINSSACGVLQRARSYPDQIVDVYAGHNGIFGARRREHGASRRRHKTNANASRRRT